MTIDKTYERDLRVFSREHGISPNEAERMLSAVGLYLLRLAGETAATEIWEVVQAGRRAEQEHGIPFPSAIRQAVERIKNKGAA